MRLLALRLFEIEIESGNMNAGVSSTYDRQVGDGDGPHLLIEGGTMRVQYKRGVAGSTNTNKENKFMNFARLFPTAAAKLHARRQGAFCDNEAVKQLDYGRQAGFPPPRNCLVSFPPRPQS